LRPKPPNNKKMDKIIQFSTIINKVETAPDGCLKIRLETQELPPEQKTIIFELVNRQVWAAVKDSPIRVDEIKIKETALIGQAVSKKKSMSQKLREIMYIYYNQKFGADGFDDWYSLMMSNLIDQWKEKINNL